MYERSTPLIAPDVTARIRSQGRLLAIWTRTMAARKSSHRYWMLRDIPRTYVLVVWLAFGAALLIYSNDWHPSGWSALRQEATAMKHPASVHEPDTSSIHIASSHREPDPGAIIIVPSRGEDCRQMMLDNRTGRMWDKGVVNCCEAGSRSEKEQRGGMSSLRINAIGKAFNRRDE